ncbi:MAG: endonuclease/exonuclease/phosphatase family protein [Pseudomonadota bacterium]
MARDLMRDRAADIDAILATIVQATPDIITLHDVDWDAGLVAATAFQTRLARSGWDMPHLVARRPNSGMATGLDMDGDGRVGRARDAQGYGLFSGAGGMIMLSRYPILSVDDYSDVLWSGLAWARLPRVDGAPFPSARAQGAQRLSSVGHWAVAIDTPGAPVTVLTHHATPPVFDGPEDRNGLRNRDELLFWARWAETMETGAYVLAAVTNLDAKRGDGLRDAWAALAPHFQDVAPKSADADGVPSDVTARFEQPGPLRTTHVLPATGCPVTGSGLIWPEEPRGLGDRRFTRHALVYVDMVPDGCGERGAGIGALAVGQ